MYGELQLGTNYPLSKMCNAQVLSDTVVGWPAVMISTQTMILITSVL